MTTRAVLLVLLLVAAPALANGRLRAVGIPDSDLYLLHHRVTGTINDRIAEITVEQGFLAKRGRNVEAIYEFSLPRDATVTSIAMTMDGEWVDGSVLERGQAKRTYQRIVSKKRDPALLERLGDERYRIRIFPLTGGEEVLVRFTYQQVLATHQGAVEFRYHSARARLNGITPSGYTGTLRITSPRVIEQVDSPGLVLNVVRESDNAVTLDWDLAGNAIAKDTVLRIRDRRDRVTFTLLGHRRSGEDGTFLAILQPPVEIAEGDILPKDVVFVIDRSGSMGGDKIREAKSALKRGIAGLRAGDRFNVLAFSTGTDSFREGLVAVGEETRKDAMAWVDRIVATGGTALDAALLASLTMGSSERLGIVALLTDGLPTVGISDPASIVHRLRAHNVHNHRVFVFGVGLDQNSKFLDRMAHVTRAAREDITNAAAVAGAMKRFFRRVERPVMTDLSLTCSLPIESVSPAPLSDLFAGDEVVVVGRYPRSGPCLFTLKGRVAGREVTHEFEGQFRADGGTGCLPRFWAARQVDVLEAALAAGGARTELVPEIRRIATRYGIVTKFTAGLVLEPGDRPDTSETGVHDHVETEEVMEDAPFSGPSTNAAIGLGGGAGGASRGTAGRYKAKKTSAPAAKGLQWLARRQRPDGKIGTLAETADAMLSFLAMGYTDRGSERDNPYAKTVRSGIRALMNGQNADGRFGDDLRTHIRATLAMSEAYWMTRNPRFKRPAQLGLDFLARARSPYSGWPKEKPDTITTAEAVMALKSGKYAGLEVDPDALAGAREWFQTEGAVKTPVEREAVLLSRVWLGEQIAKHPANPEALKSMAGREWFALAAFQIDGEVESDEALLAAQKKDGSWGSIRETAVAVRILITKFRYDRMFR